MTTSIPLSQHQLSILVGGLRLLIPALKARKNTALAADAEHVLEHLQRHQTPATRGASSRIRTGENVVAVVKQED